MFSKFHQHAILTGCVDSFCLVCETHLRTEEDAANHIEKPVHLKNLKSCPYFEKFNNDHIRKVKRGYFCEFCNLLLPTAAKLGLHVTEPSHNENKGVQLIKRTGNNVAVFGDTLITEHAWNGLILDTCAVCNMEFTNLKLHIADQKHLLNLVQKKVEFGEGSSTVYRRIDDTSFHCLICNAIFALNTVSSHCKDDVHVTNVDKCRKHYQDNFESKKSEVTNGFQNGKDDCLKAQVDDTPKSNDESPKMKKSKPNPKTFISNGNEFSGNKPDIKHSNAGKQDGQNADETKSAQKGQIPIDTLIRKCAYDLSSAANKNLRIQNLFESVNEFEKNGVNINFERETAFCKKCFVSVDLDAEDIKQHIAEHKTSPKKEASTNTVHTLNEKCSKTVLNKLEKTEAEDLKKCAVNLDQNQNITKEKVQESSKEEIIKLDLRKTTDAIEENEGNNSLVRFVPGPSTAKPPKPKDVEQPTKKEVPNIKDPATFAKQNSITYNKGNGNAYCRTCNKKIPATIKNMQEHVAGMSHKTKVARIAEMERAPKTIPTKPMERFIHQTSTVMNVFGVDDVILNDKFCLTRMSYYMITTTNRLRCQACEVNLREEDVCSHVDTARHERAMEKTPVVTNLNSEFVREVRTGLYHCGYCNLIVGPWEEVGCHLKCSEHARSKREAIERRDEHLPGILAHREQREDNLIRLALMQRFGMNFF